MIDYPHGFPPIQNPPPVGSQRFAQIGQLRVRIADMIEDGDFSPATKKHLQRADLYLVLAQKLNK